MSNNDYIWWFAILGLYNTQLGLSNITKNEEQEQRQIRIEQKLNKILKILGDDTNE